MSEFFCPPKDSITPNLEETARYLGYKKITPPDQDISDLIQKAATQMQAIIQPQATYEFFPLAIDFLTPTPKISVADFTFNSQDLARNLKNCNHVALMAATIGPQVDALIRKEQAKDTVYAAILQATGAMYIEELVQMVNDKIKAQAEKMGKSTKPRFSPGFGDLELSLQKDFFRVLPCARIGLTLMDTLIMAPEKSVTAFVGIEK